MSDWYTVFIQPKINAIIRDGNITREVIEISKLFSGIGSRYVGTDGAPHNIIYEGLTIPRINGENDVCDRICNRDFLDQCETGGCGERLNRFDNLDIIDRLDRFDAFERVQGIDRLDRLDRLGRDRLEMRRIERERLDRGDRINGLRDRFGDRLGERGFLPVGTERSSIAIYDSLQERYSMRPLIEYIAAYYKLAAFYNNDEITLLDRRTTREGRPIIPLTYIVYSNYIRAYYNLRSFFDNFRGDPKSYNVFLFRFAIDPIYLEELLNIIYDKLFLSRIFVRYIRVFERDYARTTQYESGATANGLYVLSRATALTSRNGLRKLRLP